MNLTIKSQENKVPFSSLSPGDGFYNCEGLFMKTLHKHGVNAIMLCDTNGATTPQPWAIGADWMVTKCKVSIQLDIP